MARVYKNGPWAESGRVMPGKRKEPKHIDQLLPNGEIIVVEEDQKFSSKETKDLLNRIFPGELEVKNKLLFFKKKTKNGRELCFYTRNVIHLGGYWSSEKKRIEVGDDFPDLYAQNKRNNIETILLGCYHYYLNGKDGVRLYVCFSANTYASRNTNNSAAHVHTIDLQNALKNGIYRRLDKSNNELLVLNEENFKKHVHNLMTGAELQEIKDDKHLLDYFGQMYATLPKTLYGIDCYKQMFADNDQNRKQGAWEGWYMEYYVKKYLKLHHSKAIKWWSRKKSGDLDFDLKFCTEENFYGDVKSDDAKKSIQGNKKSNIDILVKEKRGRLWYIVFEFSPEKDSKHGNETTVWWNKKLGKEKLHSYASRMKYSITFESMNVYEINQFAFKYLKEFEVSPCNGRPREKKYRIPNKMKEYLRIYQCT